MIAHEAQIAPFVPGMLAAILAVAGLFLNGRVRRL